MAARGCELADCVWDEDEVVKYCIECGRGGGCTCRVGPEPRHSASGGIVAERDPQCPRHGDVATETAR